eukprot:5303341-Amphidinium_carterae.1
MMWRLRRRSARVKFPLLEHSFNTGDLLIQPGNVLGVQVSTFPSPVLLSGVQKQVRGDGNCFWRSCAALRSPWKKLKRSVVGGYHCMFDTFLPFRRACHRSPGFGCHVGHASKKNAWVNIDMIQVFAADQETQVVLCTPTYAGSHCNAWEATCVVTPQCVRHLIFLHYNGYHYNRLCVPSDQKCKFLRSSAKGEGHSPSGLLDRAGGGASKRKASATPAPAPSASPHPMHDNPLVVDITPSGPAVAVVEVHFPRKASTRFVGCCDCTMRHVKELVALLGHNSVERITLRDNAGVVLDDDDICELGQTATVFVTLEAPLQSRRTRSRTSSAKTTSPRKGMKKIKTVTEDECEKMREAIPVTPGIHFFDDPVSPTVRYRSGASVASPTASGCRPDGSSGDNVGDAGCLARQQLDDVADQVHRINQVHELKSAIKSTRAKVGARHIRFHDSSVHPRAIPGKLEASGHEVAGAMLLTQGIKQTPFDILVEELDLPLLDLVKQIAQPGRWTPVAGGLVISTTTTFRELMDKGQHQVLLISEFSTYCSLNGKTHACLSQTSKCRDDMVMQCIGKGAWAIVPGDGACFWHSLARTLGCDSWCLRDNVVQEMRALAPYLSEHVGGSVALWTDLADVHWKDRSCWADSQIALAVSLILSVEIWVWDTYDHSLTRFGGIDPLHSVVLRCKDDHFMPWIGQIGDMHSLMSTHTGRMFPPTLCGGGTGGGGKGEDSQGWRSKLKNVVKDATDEQRDPGRAVGKLRALGLEYLLARKHWPMLLAVEPYLTVLLNTCSDGEKLKAEIVKAAGRRDLTVNNSPTPPSAGIGPTLAPLGKMPDKLKVTLVALPLDLLVAQALGEGKGREKPKWQPLPRPDTPDAVYLLQATEWDVKIVESWTKDEDCVVMCQNIDDLKDLVKKCVGTARRVAAVAPFCTTSNGLSSERIFFGFSKKVGDKETQGTLPGFLYQLGASPVLHKSACTYLESKADADASIIIQALWPADCMEPDKWEKIKGGDLHCFKKMIDEVLHFKLVALIVDVFKLGRISDSAATAGLENDLYFNPVGDKRQDFKVLWLRKEEAGSRQQAIDFIQKSSVTEGASGLVWKHEGLGIRYTPSKCDAQKLLLGRPAGSLWTVAGLPFDASDEVVSDLLKGMQWVCEIIPGSRRTKQGSAAWR